MSKYYLKGRNEGDRVTIGVDHAGFLYVHLNEERYESAMDEGEEPDPATCWVRDIFFDQHEQPLLTALNHAREVADVDDELAAIIREDYRMAIGQREIVREEVEELTRIAKSRPGVITGWSGFGQF